MTDRMVYETFRRDDLAESDPIWNDAMDLYGDYYEYLENDESQRPASNWHWARLPEDEFMTMFLPTRDSTITRCKMGGAVVGHALCVRWPCRLRHPSRNRGRDADAVACWVTQVVVHQDAREMGVATGLMDAVLALTAAGRAARWSTDTTDGQRGSRAGGDCACGGGDDDQEPTLVYGTLSPHPAVHLALARAYARRHRLDEAVQPLDHIRLDFVRAHAAAVLAASPCPQLRRASPAGSLFQRGLLGVLLWPKVGGRRYMCLDCGAETDFTSPPSDVGSYVRRARDRGWSLGSLAPGCEFMLVVPADPAVHKRFAHPQSVFSWLLGLLGE
ncbi:hypothetical protein RB597_002893 [Gaeumannomyces tritici]